MDALLAEFRKLDKHSARKKEEELKRARELESSPWDSEVEIGESQFPEFDSEDELPIRWGDETHEDDDEISVITTSTDQEVEFLSMLRSRRPGGAIKSISNNVATSFEIPPTGNASDRGLPPPVQ